MLIRDMPGSTDPRTYFCTLYNNDRTTVDGLQLIGSQVQANLNKIPLVFFGVDINGEYVAKIQMPDNTTQTMYLDSLGEFGFCIPKDKINGTIFNGIGKEKFHEYFDEHDRQWEENQELKRKEMISVCNNTDGIYGTIDKRKKTFEKCGEDKFEYTTHEELAKAGFFYSGDSDKAKCYTCDYVFNPLQKGDIPFIQHMNWMSECYYVEKNMDKKFISEINSLCNDRDEIENEKNALERIVSSGKLKEGDDYKGGVNELTSKINELTSKINELNQKVNTLYKSEFAQSGAGLIQ